MGCLEMGSDWQFDSTLVAGVQNTTADVISRWVYDSINDHLCDARPGVAWREQVLEPAAVDICTSVLDASSSASQLHRRLRELTCRVGGRGVRFKG